ncbi:D-alanyl-D-alanine carboxypeptidase family protein [Synechococcales cyanobacterium C]|uniref:D-alanyl-D-alanine carboxypeptidase family protein n=1 Tax=Petrachloros mirabilis ULC683 TaxID=2781853 RepID=A0A8K2A8F4_9CYAN|nr:M15 family metallopeptidase [Petrachloros mirabilis]NCJ07969.1 D-alanyl-D-alanine carboxypeptidase family protein [Petrachloros mirabilis ULC683]
MHDDIPEALRQSLYDVPERPRPFRFRWWMLAAISALLIIVLGSLWRILVPGAPPVTSEAPPPAVQIQERVVTAEDLLGHYPYEAAASGELMPITADGSVTLRTAAATAYQRMEADARAAGITLVPLSGFRSVEDQEYLFFRVREQRNQEVSTRAEVSAPPGYSEHHTGYALDIGDGSQPETDLSERFEQTLAYAWLEQNAARYSFELSFPRDNAQKIAYEPWHWRFVGDSHSLETFYRARQSL